MSSHLRGRQCANLLNATNLAARLDRPLTHFVTLTIGAPDPFGECSSEQFARLRDNYFCPWWRRTAADGGRPPVFVWAIENAGGVIAVHWLVRLPPSHLKQFEERLPLWLCKVTSKPFEPGSVHIRPAHTPVGAAKYMLKGADPASAERYGVRPVFQGRVRGKRSGVSRALGPTARKRLTALGVVPPLRRVLPAAGRGRPPS